MTVGKRANKNLNSFFRRLPAAFDRFGRRGTLLVSEPVDRVFGGFSLDPRPGSLGSRWLSYFAQPLYVPTEYVTLSWGSRISPKSNASYVSPVVVSDASADEIEATITVMINQGLPMLERMLSLQGFYDFLNQRDWMWVSHIYGYEALACTAVLLGIPDTALEHIREARIHTDLLPREYEPKIERQVLARLEQLEAYLHRGKLSSAVAILDEWQEYTVGNLNIGPLMAAVQSTPRP